MIYTRDCRPDSPWDAQVYLIRYGDDAPWSAKARWVLAVCAKYEATGDDRAHSWSHHRWVQHQQQGQGVAA
jgi:hypothetical protein